MKRLFLLMVMVCGVAGAQEKGTWRAASKTAGQVTGDVTFSNEKMSINFMTYPVAQIRALEPGEIGAVFGEESGARGKGNLYRLSVPGTQKFLHKNTLCGGDETQWVATYVVGHNLQLAFFSGGAMPVFTVEGISNGGNLCGVFGYAR